MNLGSPITEIIFKRRMYDRYLLKHNMFVMLAWELIKKVCADAPFINNTVIDKVNRDVSMHDVIKFSPEEYEAYRIKHYPTRAEKQGDFRKILEDYDKAWTHHVHHSPHHWENWLTMYYRNRRTAGEEKALEEATVHCLHMLADWIGIFLQNENGDSKTLKGWWEENKNVIPLPEWALKIVDYVYDKIAKIVNADRS